MTLIITAIFAGTCGLTAALLVVQLLRLELNNKPVIINTMRYLLLIGSAAYLLKICIDTLQFHISSTSPRFWIMFLAWPFVFGILPQLLWFSFFRRQLISLTGLVVIWAITIAFVPWAFPQTVKTLMLHPGLHVHTEFSFTDYLEMVAAYAVLFGGIYYGLSRDNIGMLNQTETVKLVAKPTKAAEAA